MQNASNVPAGTFWQTGAASKAPKVAAGDPTLYVPVGTYLRQVQAASRPYEAVSCRRLLAGEPRDLVGSGELTKCSCRNIVENFIERHILFRDRFERDLPLLRPESIDLGA